MIAAIVTLGGIGHLRPAPGTWGSLATVAVAAVAALFGALWVTPLLFLLATLLGFAAVPAYVRARGDNDPSEVVIDEMAGQALALSLALAPVIIRGGDAFALAGGGGAWILAFLLFRLFDIRKPWLVGRADRRRDAAGVMLDDLWAGLFAGLVTLVPVLFLAW